MAEILVTGAGGFLGRHVCAALGARGIDYTALPRECDLTDQAETYDALRLYTPRILIHLACPTPGGLGEMQKRPLRIGDMGVIDANLIEAVVVAATRVERVIAVGSLCSYDPLTSINGPYGVAKNYLHALLEAAHRQSGLAYSFLELTNLYGPGDRSQHVIPSTLRKLLAAKAGISAPPVIWGDGSDTRAFCYVEDAASAIAAAVHDQGVMVNRLGPWETVHIRRLVTDLAELLQYDGAIQWDPSAPSLARYHPGPTRYAPRTTPLRQGLALTVEWWLAHPETQETPQP